MKTVRKHQPGFLISFIIGCAVILIYQTAWATTEAPDKTYHPQSRAVALQTLDGKLVSIEGNFYVIEDRAGKQHRLRLSNHATLLKGPKKPGDVIQLEVIDARAVTIK